MIGADLPHGGRHCHERSCNGRQASIEERARWRGRNDRQYMGRKRVELNGAEEIQRAEVYGELGSDATIAQSVGE